MQAMQTALPGVWLLEPQVHGDERGFFVESYNQRAFEAATGCSVSFVQDNHSRSAARVLRGLHYQLPPHAQGKLVRVVAGAVFDVVVDLRRDSASFGRWTSAELSADNKRQLWVPPGCAHGFLALAEGTEVIYKTTAYHDAAAERCIRWDDPQLAIDWPLAGSRPQLSARDAAAPALAEAELP
ncbi:dTDP-4-dehydrorhamnose 3,5-epimerase [Schlegelella sp. S2-27]|uniref:dTDP-4-dehydrorhamnose 3,5-epimerase n=1 Tax=Caldimonas mangrovi TaxID=2944811 RepID=A0ABT0YJX4_9BURK|nr:dTDP-4-dehydrorhamnose 3,5-epimerase [Caldimonas mangrovi]MCM5679028.1 dTDP-4-dehydrorhamnose 3,5-epimerase [Caldimonas mangrovi]